MQIDLVGPWVRPRILHFSREGDAAGLHPRLPYSELLEAPKSGRSY